MSLPLSSLSRPKRRRGLHAEIVDQLGQMIVTSDPMTTGSLVPEKLGQHFDVSRTVIREALRALESKGLITARPNVGTRVRPVSDWNLLDPDVIEWRALGPQGGDQRSELRELRQVIETFTARLAAAMDRLNTWELLNAVVDMTDAVRHDQADQFDQADARFHQHLARAADSLMLNHLSTLVTRGLAACAEPPTCDRTQASVKRHEAVISALRQQGSEEAEGAMRDLLTTPLGTAPHVKPSVPRQHA